MDFSLTDYMKIFEFALQKKSSNFVYISAFQCGLQFDDFLRIFQADLKKKI